MCSYQDVCFTGNTNMRAHHWPTKACKHQYKNNTIDKMLDLQFLWNNSKVKSFYAKTWMGNRPQANEIGPRGLQVKLKRHKNKSRVSRSYSATYVHPLALGPQWSLVVMSPTLGLGSLEGPELQVKSVHVDLPRQKVPCHTPMSWKTNKTTINALLRVMHILKGIDRRTTGRILELKADRYTSEDDWRDTGAGSGRVHMRPRLDAYWSAKKWHLPQAAREPL